MLDGRTDIYVSFGVDRLLLLLLASLFLANCASLNRYSERQLDKMLDEDIPAFREAFTGFALYDPESDELLYSHFGDRYFSPASNVKILTLYTALRAMGDSIPMLRYHINGQRLILSGTGCAAFLHPDLPQDSTFLDFLSSWEGPIQVYFPPLHDEKYGPGWAWDDGVFYYQSERSSFPIYGNAVSFTMDTNKWTLEAHPELFQITTQEVPGPHEESFLRKRRRGNVYEYGISENDGIRVFDRRLPFQVSAQLFTDLLSDQLGKEVSVSIHPPQTQQTIYYPYPDSLYAYFMHRSDNFIAEQLLLQSALVWTDSMNATRAIEHMKQNYFSAFPSKAIWVDGSGLSRYNMLTPHFIVTLLDTFYDEYSPGQWKTWFPAGGKEGTIKEWYGGHPAWIYAKTGTLSNNHCLSGFLITERGKVLLFSFMNNHYTGSSTPYKRAMERVLRYIRSTYK